MGKITTHEEYVKLLNNHNQDLKLLTEFKGYNKKIKVIDSDNIIYNVNARSILDNLYPSIRCAINKTEAFNIKLKKIFPDLELVEEYTQGNIKTRIKDNIGIIYHLKPESLLIGNYPSIVTAIDKTEAFKIKSKLIHGDKYDYSLSEYKGDKIKTKIICKEHGIFEQRPNNHIKQNAGCPKCHQARGWTKTNWINFAKDKICTFYIINCYNEKENFIKFGITASSTKKRFQSKREMPYKFSIIKELFGSGDEVWDLEQNLSKKYKLQKYSPSLHFKGVGECYNNTILNEIIIF